MKKSLIVFKRITCVLGILFIVLGVIPIPAVSVISEVSANTTVSGESASQALPRFSSIKLVDVLSQDEGGEAPTEEPPAEEPPADLPPVEISPEPTVEPPAEEPPVEPTEEPTLPGEELGGTGECLEEAGCVPVTGASIEAETCRSNGTGCSHDYQCCSNNCAGSGSNKTCQCVTDNHSCYSSSQCCSGFCNASNKCQTCDAYQACPTACGQPAQDLPNGSCGTHHCDATAACPCTAENGSCDANEECCEGLSCIGNHCKPPVPACKEEGMPCGGANVCCEGLSCYQKPGQEAEKCWPACTPSGTCPTGCGQPAQDIPDGCGGTIHCSATAPCPVDCVLGDYGPCSAECGGGTQTQIILVPAQNGGSCNPDTRECNTQPCPIDCVGEWGLCEGECGIENGTQTFTITTPAQYGGVECEFEDQETRECATDPCPEDCVGSWGECVGNCGEEGIQTYTITKPAANGGAECEFADQATQACQMDPCPIDCEWGEWSECSAQCGPGTQTREIAIQAQYGGLECEGPTEQECYAGDCPAQLVLDPTCVTGHLGNARFSWSFSNPSGMSVPVSWSLDGNTGAGVIGPHETINVGQTTDGPAYHSLSVYWPGGSKTVSSNYNCDPGGGVTTTGGGGPGGIIPVTGAGGPTEELLIIPVTGVDLGSELAGFQKLFLYMGLMLFGVTMVLEGVTKKYRI